MCINTSVILTLLRKSRQFHQISSWINLCKNNGGENSNYVCFSFRWCMVIVQKLVRPVLHQLVERFFGRYLKELCMQSNVYLLISNSHWRSIFASANAWQSMYLRWWICHWLTVFCPHVLRSVVRLYPQFVKPLWKNSFLCSWLWGSWNAHAAFVISFTSKNSCRTSESKTSPAGELSPRQAEMCYKRLTFWNF